MSHQDIVSEVFATLRIRSDLYFRAGFHGAYAIEVPKEHRCIRFHLVREGQCYLQVPGSEPVLLRAGDMAIIPDGAAQQLSSDPRLAPLSLADAMAAGTLAQGRFSYGEGERGVSLLCGYCTFDEAMDHPVLTALPTFLVLNQASLEPEPWLAATLTLLRLESDLDAPGMTGILSRLLEIVFIQAVRRLTDNGEVKSSGFFQGLADGKLSKALHLIHQRPEHGWTIASLANEAGMSRARFADRFTRVIGVPPIGYLTQWRLMKSRSLLSRTDLGLEEIAARCGYASATSFSRRFKEAFAMGPGAYRKSCQCPG